MTSERIIDFRSTMKEIIDHKNGIAPSDFDICDQSEFSNGGQLLSKKIHKLNLRKDKETESRKTVDMKI